MPGTWITPELKCLLDIFKKMNFDVLRTSRIVSSEISSHLATSGFTRSRVAIHRKMKKLVHKYRKIKKSLKKKAEVNWPWFNDMRELIEASPSKVNLDVSDNSLDDPVDLNKSMASQLEDRSWTDDEIESLFAFFKVHGDCNFTHVTGQDCSDISGHLADLNFHRSARAVMAKVKWFNKKYKNLVKAWAKDRLLNKDWEFYEQVHQLVQRHAPGQQSNQSPANA